MKIRQSASIASLIAIVSLLLAVGPAAAGNYSPKHLRAESFLRLRALDFEPGLKPRLPNTEIPFEIGFRYPLAFGGASMVLHLSADTKLRRLVKFEVHF